MLLAAVAYFGLGIAGPSALPSVILVIAAAASAIGLAAALWTGFGGRKVAVISLVQGVALAVLLFATGSDESTIETRLGSALVGVAMALASAFALRRHRSAARTR